MPYSRCPMPFLRIVALWIGLLCITVSCVASEFDTVYRGAKGLGNLRIWGAGYYDMTKIEPEDFAPMDSDMFGLMGGLELKRRSGSVLGVYYHYASEETKWEPNLLDLIDGDAKHHIIGLTFRKPLPLSHILLNVNGGLDQYGLRFDSDEALKPKGYQANVYPEFGLNIPIGKMIGLKPYLAVHYHYLHHDDISTYWDKADYHGLNNLLGLRTNLALGNIFQLQGRASWVHEYLKESPTSLSYFSSLPGHFTPIRCNFEGDTARDWAWLGVGARLSFGHNLRLFADYDLTLNARQTSHTISCCLCLGW